MRTVGVVTVGRSDYGILRPVLRALAARPELEVVLFVGGMHLRERFGLTVEEVERDGFPVAARLDFLADDDSPVAIARATGRGVEAFADALDAVRPDLLVILGDRSEMLAAGVAALPLTIPLAHVHGGEVTVGAIDESIRHALTKLSHLHFVATAEYRRRVVQLGEEPWRVVVSGAPALDEALAFAPLADDELAERGVRLRGPTLLVTQHPVTLALERTDEDVAAVLGAVADSGLDAVLTYPNADAGHLGIVEALERFAASSERYTLVRNLGQHAYFTLLKRTAAMVGNSSSGIVEAASFALPVVDVGERQRGRLRARNVLHAPPERTAVAAAIAHAVSPSFRRTLDGLVNPYGDGRASERIAETLATVPLDDRLLVKRFHDLPSAAPPGDAGRM
jgi:UDP-hydrolysing UDP-N-acetyl-D-glucosamine 2-epimerase